jgi:hypothetical protein
MQLELKGYSVVMYLLRWKKMLGVLGCSAAGEYSASFCSQSL